MIKCRKCNIIKNNLEYNISRLKKSDYICKICEKEYNINYNKFNKEKILNKRKNCRNINKEKVKKSQLKYTLNNKDKKREYDKKYKKNKSVIEKIKNCISRSINFMLLNNNIRKNKAKILNFIPWTIQELKNHIEYHFSLPGNEWMNWSNRGNYKINQWDDNDPKTWKWQLDHIIPHSKFKYSSMEDSLFKECWALSNLRPYSAKQNLIDGNRR